MNSIVSLSISEDILNKWVRKSEIDPNGTNRELKQLAKESPYTARRIGDEIQGRRSVKRG